jgi:HTH-type transcriptional regulator/antitoxin HigA
MELKIIRTKKHYHASLERFEERFSAKSETKESNEADVLALLIQDYENKYFIIGAPSPIEAIK